ncbi:MAG: type II toxin-antitoxin system PemK/MazF family toxin [Planctomycetaceae bacterium]|jgi:mRNA interferase MazF|nr:type II toxin-antitoxin system PemK/MazF family toxin [Planctomycetaceae bacterium]
MGRFIRGDVVVVPFPFSDLSGTKKRPALVLVNLKGNDLILCQITSQNIKDEYSIALSNNDVIDGELKILSNIRPNKIFTTDESIILYKVCSLNEEKIVSVTKNVVDMFNL